MNEINEENLEKFRIEVMAYILNSPDTYRVNLTSEGRPYSSEVLRVISSSEHIILGHESTYSVVNRPHGSGADFAGGQRSYDDNLSDLLQESFRKGRDITGFSRTEAIALQKDSEYKNKLLNNALQRMSKIIYRSNISNYDISKVYALTLRSDLKKYLCPILQRGSDDIFDLCKTVIPILVTLSVTGVIKMPIEPAICAGFIFEISRMGLAGYCGARAEPGKLEATSKEKLPLAGTVSDRFSQASLAFPRHRRRKGSRKVKT